MILASSFVVRASARFPDSIKNHSTIDPWPFPTFLPFKMTSLSHPKTGLIQRHSLLSLSCYVLIFLATLILMSCRKSTPHPKDIAGLYELRHTDGKLELWELYSNGVLRQLFYLNDKNRKTGKSILEFKSTWSLEGGGIRFENSFSFINFGNWELLEEPERTTNKIANWWPPASGNPALIEFIEGAGFIASRVSP